MLGPINVTTILQFLVHYIEAGGNVHTHTHTHTNRFCGSLDFVRDNPGEPVPEETFIHSHLSWSSFIPYLLPPSIMSHGILPLQFTYLTVFFHNLSPSFLWSTSWSGTLHFILHTFLHPIIVFFSQHMPTATCFVHPFLCYKYLYTIRSLFTSHPEQLISFAFSSIELATTSFPSRFLNACHVNFSIQQCLYYFTCSTLYLSVT